MDMWTLHLSQFVQIKQPSPTGTMEKEHLLLFVYLKTAVDNL